MENVVTTMKRAVIKGVVGGSRSARRIRLGRSSSVVVVVATTLSAVLLRRRLIRWGATDAELQLTLAGDELLPAINLASTRSVAINASPGQVWPWLVQLGQGRGGFYSYDFLENLVGLKIHSADRIHPEWQQLTVGSTIRLASQVALTVAVLQPDRALVLRGGVPLGVAAPPYDFTWAFTLQPGPAGTTRLVVRERYCYSRGWAGLVVQPAELISCLMSPRMLRGIKRRAEQAGAGRVDAQPADRGISA